MTDPREFIKTTLANNPALTKRHFIFRCGIPAKIVNGLEAEGVKFGDPTKYREKMRKFRI